MLREHVRKTSLHGSTSQRYIYIFMLVKINLLLDYYSQTQSHSYFETPVASTTLANSFKRTLYRIFQNLWSKTENIILKYVVIGALLP